MGRFRSTSTGVVVSVDDSKDDRYTDGWEPATEAASSDTAPAKKTSACKSEK